MDQTAVEVTSKKNVPSCVQNILHGFLTTKLQVIERERNDCSADRGGATSKRRKTISDAMRPEFDEFQCSEYGTARPQASNVLNDSRCSTDLSLWNHSEHSSSHDYSGIRYSRDSCEEPRVCRRLRKVSQPSEYPNETLARTYFKRNVRAQMFSGSVSATDTNAHQSLDTRHSQRSETAYDTFESQTDSGKSRTKHGQKKRSKKCHEPRRKKESTAANCSSLDGLRKSEADHIFGDEGHFSTIRHKTSTKKMKTTNAQLETHQETEGYKDTWVGRYNSTKMFRKRRLESSSNKGSSMMSMHSLYSRELPAIPSTTENICNGIRHWKSSERYENRSDEDCSYRSEFDGTSYVPHKAEKLSSGCNKKRKDKSSSDRRHKRKKRHKGDDVVWDSEKQLVKKNFSRTNRPPKAKCRKHSMKSERKHKHRNNRKTESNGEMTKEPDDVIDEESFRPMQVHAEPNDDVTELLFKNRNTSNKSSDGQLDYDAVIACAEASSLPPRLVKTYRDGVAVSRLLKRVKTRLGPIKPAVIQRNVATLPRHPVLVLKDKHDTNDPVGDCISLKSTVVQDVEDPGPRGKVATKTDEDEVRTVLKEEIHSNICDELSLTVAATSEDNCSEIRATALRNLCSDSDIFTHEKQNDDSLRSELQVSVNIAVQNQDNSYKALIDTDTIPAEAEGELIDGNTNETKSQAFEFELSTDLLNKALPLESGNDDSTERCCSIENLEIEAVVEAGEINCSLERIPVVEEAASGKDIGDEAEDKVAQQDFEELDVMLSSVADKSDVNVNCETISVFDINNTLENTISVNDDSQLLTENTENKRRKFEKLYLNSYVREGCSDTDYPQMSSDHIDRMIEQIRNAGSADQSECQLEMIARDPHGDHSDCEMETARRASIERDFGEKSNDRKDVHIEQHSEEEQTCLPGENAPKPELWSMKKAAKKLAKHMGIKISDWSTAFILSGERYENDPKKRNREEGMQFTFIISVIIFNHLAP